MKPDRMYRIATAAALVAAIAVAGGCGGSSEAALLSSAKALLDKQDAAGAVLQLKSALQGNPQSAEARFLLGRALFLNGDSASAVAELDRAASLGFSNDEVLPWLAKAMVAAGQSKAVVDRYNTTVLTAPKVNAELKAAVAAAHATLGQMAECEIALKAALAADEQNLSARLQMARLTAGKGAIDDALTQVDGLLKDKPRLREAWLLKAQLLWISQGDLEGAKKAFADALASDPRYPEAHAGLAALLFQQRDMAAFKARVADMRKVLPDRLETRYYEAHVALLDSNFQVARGITQQLLKSSPNNASVLQLAATVELNGGSTLLAERHLKKVLAASPEQPEARRLLAKTYLRAGEPDKALAPLKSLLDAQQPRAEDLALAAESHLLSGDLVRAEDFFKRALKLSPDAVNLRTAVALTQVSKGNPEAGLQELESIATGSGGSTYADMALISMRLRRNETGQALKAIDRLQEKMADSPLPHHLRGKVLIRQRDIPGARKSLELALTKDPTYFAATTTLVALDLAEKKPEDAQQRYRAVLAREPKNSRAMVALALLLSSTGAASTEVVELLDRAVKESPDDAAARVVQIDFMLGRHDIKNANVAAEAGLAAMPDDLLLLDALARVQVAGGNLRQAIATLTKATTIKPGSAQAHLRLAEGYLAAQDHDNATRSLRRALELAPDSIAARRALVMVAVSRKRFDEGLAIARQLQKDRPNESVGWQLQSDIQALQRDWPAAINSMRESLKRASTREAAVRLVELYAAAGRLQEADAFVTSWMKDHPRHPEVVFQLGAAWLVKGNYARAENRFREVLALRPEHAMALNNVAWLMVQQNKPGAATLAAQALKVSPNEAQLMDTLALALSADGETGKAIEWQRKAVSQAPKEAVFRMGLARLLVKNGDKVQAREELETLSKLGPAFEGQPEVTELLKKL